MDIPTSRYEIIDGTFQPIGIQPIGIQQIGIQPIMYIQQVIDPTSTSTTIETISIRTLSLS